METRFPKLFSPLQIRNMTVKNRICSTGHDTDLGANNMPGPNLVEYQRARARGGAGLIVLEVAGVHVSGRYTASMMMADDDACIPAFRDVAEACHESDCRVIAQLFHPGREILQSPEGVFPISYSASALPNERFHVMPRAMSKDLIQEIVTSFGDSAARMKAADMDGVEIVSSHGYLPAQFLNPRSNVRTDEYGGSLEGRLRFLREVIADIRAKIGDDVIGLRLSGAAWDPEGLTREDISEICAALDADGEVDYYNITAGNSATLSGSIHIVPPMGTFGEAYAAPDAAAVRAVVNKPVIVTGKIHRPAIAERVISDGQADMCGMTRAMICDPEVGNKALEGREDEIRECIGCNQACIGHMHLGYPISCIQHPETGREVEYGTREAVSKPRRVFVIGGGPAGMKAAAVAAERGHEVSLFESSARLGGQALLAASLPGRADFGGIVPNLTREMEEAGVRVVMKTEATAEMIREAAPDAVILATGATPFTPDLEELDEERTVQAWDVVTGKAVLGRSVAIADWRCDWVGLGVAEILAKQGHQVTLCVNGTMPGQTIQQYVRDVGLGTMHKLGVKVIPMMRLAGIVDDTVYFQHTMSGEPEIIEGIDTVVLAMGGKSVNALESELQEGYVGDLTLIGDCASPRTAEEAVFEGLKAGVTV